MSMIFPVDPFSYPEITILLVVDPFRDELRRLTLSIENVEPTNVGTGQFPDFLIFSLSTLLTSHIVHIDFHSQTSIAS